MATFFGEVVVAPSRAGLDEEEEAREETPEDREIRREIEKKREIQVLWSCGFPVIFYPGFCVLGSDWSCEAVE